jgi:hypothetical protein
VFVLQSTLTRHHSSKLLLLWCTHIQAAKTFPSKLVLLWGDVHHKKKAFEVAVILMWCTSILLRTSLQSFCYCNVMLSHVSCCSSQLQISLQICCYCDVMCIHPIWNFPSKLLLLPCDARSSYKKTSPKASVIAMWYAFILWRISLLICSYCDAVYIHPVQKFLYLYGIRTFILILDLPCNDQFTSSTHKIRQRLSVHALEVKTMKGIMIKLATGSLHWKLSEKFNFWYRSNVVPTLRKIWLKSHYNFPKAVCPTKNFVQLSHYRKIMLGAERFRSLGFPPDWGRINFLRQSSTSVLAPTQPPSLWPITPSRIDVKNAWSYDHRCRYAFMVKFAP